MAENQFATVEEMVKNLKPDYPVYCFRPNILENTATFFLNTFPGQVLYAAKCNPRIEILKILYKAGIKDFDVASLQEIALIHENLSGATSYFMHPVKTRSSIEISYHKYKVRNFVVDHSDELEKIHSVLKGENNLNIFVRVKTPPVEGMILHFGSKFGASSDQAVEMLKSAKSKGYKLGLTFHVGSQCPQPKAYLKGLEIVGEVLSKAKLDINFLDIGGGFPAQYARDKVLDLSEYIQAIKSGLKNLHLSEKCVLMCEPGRALVADCMSIVTQVLLKKDNQIYINDGIHGALVETVAAKVKLPARLIRLNGSPATQLISYTVNGCTCDSTDVLLTTFDLPVDVKEGDWVEIDRVGAYSNALANKFNGFYSDKMVVINEKPFSAVYPKYLESLD